MWDNAGGPLGPLNQNRSGCAYWAYVHSDPVDPTIKAALIKKFVDGAEQVYALTFRVPWDLSSSLCESGVPRFTGACDGWSQ